MDKLEEAESQRKTEEEVTEPQPMVFGRFTEDGQTIVISKWENISVSCTIYLSVSRNLGRKIALCFEIQH